MTRSLILIVTTLLLSACSSPDPLVSAQQESYYNVEKKLYECVNANPIEVRFFPNHGVAVLVLNSQTHELQQQPADSGFWYSNQLYTIRGAGNELRLEIGRRMPIDCVANL